MSDNLIFSEGISFTRPEILHSFDVSNESNKVSIRLPDSLSSDYSLSLPSDDGNADQVLKTDGSGNLGWTDQVSASNLNDLGDVSLSSPSRGQVLKYNGSNWVNSEDQRGFEPTISTPKAGQMLYYDGADWKNLNGKMMFPINQTTTDNTPAVLHSFTSENDTSFFITAELMIRDETNKKTRYLTISNIFQNHSDVVSKFPGGTMGQQGNAMIGDVAFSVSGNRVVLNGTGRNATIHWNGTFEVIHTF